MNNWTDCIFTRRHVGNYIRDSMAGGDEVNGPRLDGKRRRRILRRAGSIRFRY